VAVERDVRLGEQIWDVVAKEISERFLFLLLKEG
jgi:hypothetical protein